MLIDGQPIVWKLRRDWYRFSIPWISLPDGLCVTCMQPTELKYSCRGPVPWPRQLMSMLSHGTMLTIKYPPLSVLVCYCLDCKERRRRKVAILMPVMLLVGVGCAWLLERLVRDAGVPSDTGRAWLTWGVMGPVSGLAFWRYIVHGFQPLKLRNYDKNHNTVDVRLYPESLKAQVLQEVADRANAVSAG